MASNDHISPGRRLALRGLLLAAWAGLTAAAGLATGAVLRLIGSGSAQAAPPPINLGRPDGLKPGQVRTSGRAALARDDKGFFALDLACPHLGCLTAWNREQGLFLCPCHGSRFTASGGRVSGPARRGLTHLALGLNAKGELTAHPGRPVPDRARLAAPEGS